MDFVEGSPFADLDPRHLAVEKAWNIELAPAIAHGNDNPVNGVFGDEIRQIEP
jgi:hypothetical protein